MRSVLVALGTLILASTTAMADSVYCPQNSKYISPGMTTDEVIAACGQPLSKQPSNAPVMQKIPVKQLIYMQLNTGNVYPGLNSAFYNQWSLSNGASGFTLRVDVINDKVSAISMNGSSTNASTICNGSSLQAGDDVSKVYTACGTPGMVNNTFINQIVPSNNRPEIWSYQIDRYHPPMSLTFLNGKLQSIK